LEKSYTDKNELMSDLNQAREMGLGTYWTAQAAYILTKNSTEIEYTYKLVTFKLA